MKISILTDEYPPIIGGAGVVAKQIFDNLSTKHNVFCYCSAKGPKLIFKLFWPFYYMSFKLIYNIINSDLIIINDIRSAYFLSYFPSFVISKCVYIVHGTEYEVVYTNISKKNSLICLRERYNIFVKNCKKIISVSDYTKNIFEKEIPKDVRQKLTSSYVGLSSDFIISEDERKLKCDDDIFKFVSVSRIENRKGYFEMLERFIELNNHVSTNFKWHIYGRGGIRDELIREVNSRGLNDRIIFEDETDRDLIFKHEFKKKNFDVFWLLPNQPEAFGLTFIESAARGVPSIGVFKYGIKESISKGESGYFIEDHKLDYLVSIIKNDHELQLSSIRFARKFLISNFVESLISNESN